MDNCDRGLKYDDNALAKQQAARKNFIAWVQSVNQSISQSVNQSISQSVNQSISQSVNQSI
ncbi:MAG: UDP-Gal--lipooligosaccharide galactosyltransferase, partial [Legionellales bacterium]|nr:UDP-Gal--lipooligosaccharide galactosyltransferase [Legionellales bacterium]